MKIEYWPLERLIAYSQNPRHNDGAAVAKVAESIAKYGFNQPITVDGDGVIVAGHTRLKAAYQLGLETVPVHQDFNLTPEKARAYRIADNRVHEEAAWDYSLLRLELNELPVESFTGFDSAELDAVLAEPTPIAELLPAEDAPECLSLRWGKRDVPLTAAEAETLTARFRAHVKQTGLAYGFVRTLLAA